jgi:hypothetical protein
MPQKYWQGPYDEAELLVSADEIRRFRSQDMSPEAQKVVDGVGKCLEEAEIQGDIWNAQFQTKICEVIEHGRRLFRDDGSRTITIKITPRTVSDQGAE